MRRFGESPRVEGGTTRGSNAVWHPAVRMRSWDANALRTELQKSSSTNSDLRRWTSVPSKQPPQAWWDEDDDPFSPENG